MNKNTDTNQKASAPETRKANDNFNADFHAIGTAAMFGSHDEDLQSDILEVARQLELTTAELERVKKQRDELLAALKVLVDHAQETYPHFESERGQRDIAQSLAAIA